MQKVGKQLKDVFFAMSPARRWLTAGALVAVLGVFAAIIVSNSSTRWADLGRGYTPEDQKAAIEALEQKKIPVRLGEGNVVQVPEERLDEARVEIAQHNASGGSVGMELFNESDFGQSRFQEEVNLHRALQGELERTIRSIDGIEAARVHLVRPKKTVFQRQQKAPTASIKLQLRPGVELTRRQVGGLKHLVASAIEGLAPNSVTIIDHRGDVLARPTEEGMAAGETLYEMQSVYEQKVVERIRELLEPVVPGGRVQSQVSAIMDFTQVELTEKQIDPDKQVILSEKRTEETSSSAERKAQGAPGVASNLPGGPTGDAADGSTSRTARKEDTRYDAPTTVKKTSMPVGRLKRLSVAVAVDGRMVEEEGGEAKWQPLPGEELEKIRLLVAGAVGIDESRGDTLSVVNTRFEDAELLRPEPEKVAGLAPWIRDALRYGALLVLLLLIVFGVVRPMAKAVRAGRDDAPRPALALADGGALAGEAVSPVAGALPEPAPELPRGERLRLKAVESTRDDPERATEIIRAWLLMED